jgi:ArsR family transcriptional regulator
MSNSRDKQIENYAEMFKALSNPNRLKIFLRLAALCMPGCCMPEAPVDISKEMKSEGCACVGDLGKDLDIVPSTISHHIKELKSVGLIDVTRRGQRIECRINPETMAAFQSFFA